MRIKNPTGLPPRGIDPWGSGNFMALRDGGLRHHKGLDLQSVPGQMVGSPIRGTVIREKRPYGDGAVYDHGVLIEGRGEHAGIEATLFYVRVPPGVVGSDVAAGEIIGTACSLEAKYPGIVNHVHLELKEGGTAFDPLPSIFCGKPGETRDNQA